MTTIQIRKRHMTVMPTYFVPLISEDEWRAQHAATGGTVSSTSGVLSAFWRSLAINPYDLFDAESLELRITQFLEHAIGARARKRSHTVLDLRLKLSHRAEPTADTLETHVLAGAQLNAAADGQPIVVVTLLLTPTSESVIALQLRTPALPIAATARYTAAYNEPRASSWTHRVATRPANGINYANYTQQELADSDLLNRTMVRGAFLYDQLRKNEPVTLAALVAERRVKERYVLATNAAKAERKRQPRKRPAASRESGDSDGEQGDSLASSDDDDDDEPAAVEGSEAVEAESEEALLMDDSPEGSAVSLGDDDTERSADSLVLSDVDSDADGSIVAVESVADGEEEETPAAATAAVESSTSSVEEVVAEAPPPPVRAPRRVRTPPLSAHFASPAPPFNDMSVPLVGDDSKPLKIDIQRADELQWLRLVVALGQYTMTLQVAHVVPSKELVHSAGRHFSANIEAGVSALPRVMGCTTDDTRMEFYIVNAARLQALIERERDAPLAQPDAAAADVEMAISPLLPLPLNDQIVSITDTPAAAYLDDDDDDDHANDYAHGEANAFTGTRVVNDGPSDPLRDFQRYVSIEQLTLYEIGCYGRQRLTVLLAAYQAFFCAKTPEERNDHLAGLLVSQYPVRSGAGRHIIRMLPGAREREHVHEGIGLAILCLCAKHNAALVANLVLMEMCLLRYNDARSHAAIQSRANGNYDDDESDSGNECDVNSPAFEERVRGRGESLTRFWSECTDVLAPEVANDPRYTESANAQAYSDFFALLHALAAEWLDALEEIQKREERAAEEPDTAIDEPAPVAPPLVSDD